MLQFVSLFSLDWIMDIEYVDILTGKKFRQFNLLKWKSLIGQFDHTLEVRGWGKTGGSLCHSATSFTLLEYMIIWCKIQVIINPLFYPY